MHLPKSNQHRHDHNVGQRQWAIFSLYKIYQSWKVKSRFFRLKFVYARSRLTCKKSQLKFSLFFFFCSTNSKFFSKIIEDWIVKLLGWVRPCRTAATSRYATAWRPLYPAPAIVRGPWQWRVGSPRDRWPALMATMRQNQTQRASVWTTVSIPWSVGPSSLPVLLSLRMTYIRTKAAWYHYDQATDRHDLTWRTRTKKCCLSRDTIPRKVFGLKMHQCFHLIFDAYDSNILPSLCSLHSNVNKSPLLTVI